MIDSQKLLDAYDLAVQIERGIEGYHMGQQVTDAVTGLRDMLRSMVLEQLASNKLTTITASPDKVSDDMSLGKIYQQRY